MKDNLSIDQSYTQPETLDLEIEKISNKLTKIETELKRHIVNYKKATGEDKTKWKREAAGSLKKRKFYEEYLNSLRKSQYQKEMKTIQHDIDLAKKEFEKMSNEFYANLSHFFKRDENNEELSEDDYKDQYRVDVDDTQLEEEYLRILPELDKYNENLDLTKILKKNNT